MALFKKLPLKPISEIELKWKELMPSKNFYSYQYTRGYIRHSLSELFKIPALDIPLYSNPREAPKLDKNVIIIVNSCGDAKKDRDILKKRLGKI